MKKLITLIACVLMGGSAMGQELVVNGNLEGEQEADWSSFWIQDPSKEGPTDYGQGFASHSDGTGGWKFFAPIVDNPFKKGDHCVKVHVMSEAEAVEAGNARYSGGSFVEWNTQFFIYSKVPMTEGKWIHLKFKVRGDVAGSAQSQTHQEPGKHIGNDFCGRIEYEANKWTKIEKAIQVTSSHTTKSGTPYEFRSVCFNLSSTAFTEGNNLYIDDISMVMSDEEPVIENQGSNDNTFINFLKFGTETNDSCWGTDKSGNPYACTTFTLKDPVGMGQAPVEDVDGKKTIVFSTLGFTSEQVPDLDSLGNEQPDTINGGILMKNIYKWDDGSLVGGTGSKEPDKYAYQLFITTPHKFKEGEKYRLVFWVRADKEASLNTQAHYGPGQYKNYGSFGGPDDFPVTTEWKKYELGVNEDKTISSGARNSFSVCFDCYQLKDANKYYFRFDELSFTDSNVEIGERTLGTADIALPVNDGGDDPLSTPVDVSDLLNTYKVENFDFMNKQGNYLKLIGLTVPEEEGDEPDEIFKSVDSWTDGGFVNAQGYFIGEDINGIEVGLDEDSFDGTNIDFHVWNNPEAGISFADGNTVKTKLCISKAGWYYIYNVTLMSQEAYAAAGISTVKTAKTGNGQIYNLAGQRVDKSYKGLVIKDGKKTIQR
jgi:hypothetical protein